MTDLSIRLRPSRSTEADAPGAMAITAAGLVLTRLQRPDANDSDDFVNVPLARFGFWLADNWWRLRHETRPRGQAEPDWRLAHEIASIGGGFAWPRVTVWGEGQRTVLTSQADPPGIAGPVRFLTSAVVFVGADGFETAVDDALDEIQRHTTGDDASALRAVIDTLHAERMDPEVAAWRRMEAIAGFDCDEAPEDMMRALAQLEERYTTGDIEEAVAGQPGTDTARTLQRMVDSAGPANTSPANFDDAVKSGTLLSLLDEREPWQLAEQSARMIRTALGRPDGPLRNTQLSDLLGTPVHTFKTRVPFSTTPPPYGLRIGSGKDWRQQLLLVSRRSAARRFEAVRCLGDAIWSESSALGPTTTARTARQKFQNAFAANLLCPASAVVGYVGSDNPSDDDISAAAQHFHVSEKVVRTILVNKHVLDRGSLLVPPEDLRRSISDDEILDAA